MSYSHALHLPASPTGFGLPGCWTLAPDRAITLDARQTGWLRIAQGAVWATHDGPHPQGAANAWGDIVLLPGARMHLRPGQSVVLESYPADAAACISWEPDANDGAPDRRLRTARQPLRRLVGWIGAGWRGCTRAMAASGRWAPLAPDAFADTRAHAAHTLMYLTRNQP